MRILIAHNFYQQAGGEDAVFRDEAEMLRRRGHDVHEFTVHNDAIDNRSRLVVALDTIANRRVAAQLHGIVASKGFQVAHFHNTFPIISPVSYKAVRTAGAAVVQTLHNYRLICPKATLYRDGEVCEDCVSKRFAWPSIVHRCYRDNRLATGVTASMLAYHRWRRTWHRDVDRYIALTQFAKRKLASAGLPNDKIAVKPNFVNYDGMAGDGRGGYALFVGRLSPEKGVDTLLDAWLAHDPPIALWIVGDGPLGDQVRAASKTSTKIRWLGQRPIEEVGRIMSDAAMLVLPSCWYEGFPRTIVEAYSRGLPVLASRLGSMLELIKEGVTGRLFEPHDSQDLMQKVRSIASDDGLLTRMRAAARSEYEQRYTTHRNYEELLAVYRDAMGEHKTSSIRHSSVSALSTNAAIPRAVHSTKCDLPSDRDNGGTTSISRSARLNQY